jgi:hypothetical protein
MEWYANTKKASELLGRSGLQLPRLPSLNTDRRKILTEKNLAGYRKANNTLESFAGRNAATADTHALATAERRLAAGEDAGVVGQEPVVSGQFQRDSEATSNPPPGAGE